MRIILLLVATVLGVLLWSWTPTPRPQPPVAGPPAAKLMLDRGWKAYRAGQAAEAHELARQVLQEVAKEPSQRDLAGEAQTLLQLTPQSMAATTERTSPEQHTLVVTRPPPRPRPKPAALPPPPPAPLARPSAPAPLPVATYPRRGFVPISGAPDATQQASGNLDRLMQQGRLDAAFQGTGGQPQMVEVSFSNRSSRPLHIHLSPGMVLQPQGRHVQPLMVEEDTRLTLAPGESVAMALDTYCMDSEAPAPRMGEEVDYRFEPVSDERRAQAVQVLMRARQMEAKGLFHPVLPLAQHRRAVVQIAIWRTLGQLVDDMRIQSAIGSYHRDPRVRASVLQDVERVMHGP